MLKFIGRVLMLDIFNLLRKAINEGHPTYKCILLEREYLIAGDSELAARVPYENVKEMMVEAKILGKALNATKNGEITYSTREADGNFIDTLTLKKNKREIVLDGAVPELYLKTGMLSDDVEPDEWIKIDPTFIDALKKVSVSMSEDESRPWSMAVSFHNKKMMCTDSMSLFFVNMDVEGSAVFPEKAVNFISEVAEHEYPTHFGVTKSAVSFKYASGLLISSTRNTDERQEQMAAVVEKSFVKPEFEVTTEFKECIEAATVIGERVVEIEPGRVFARSTGATFDEEIETGVPVEVGKRSFDTKRLELMFKGIKRISYTNIVACAEKSDDLFAMLSQRTSK